MTCRRCSICPLVTLSKVCRSHGRHLTHVSAPHSKQKKSFPVSSSTYHQGYRFLHQHQTSSAILTTSGDTIPTPHALLLAAKTRSALEEATEKFIRCERRRLYSIYRPSANIDTRVPSPDAYVCIIQKLSVSGMGKEGKTLYFVLEELLKKPLHPSQAGSSWDLPNGAIERLQAAAIEALMFGLEGGEALSFACNSLIAPTAETKAKGFGDGMESTSSTNESDFVFHTLMECLRSDTNRIMRRKSKEEIKGYRVILTPEFVCAVVIAFIRLNTNSSKLQGIEILQCASIARLRGLGVFNENVAVKCAEAAAVIGDAETVTRIIFILYRARGILTSETDSACLEMENCNSTGSSKSFWDRLVAHLGGRQWITVSPIDSIQNEPFHRASLRLLKSVIHAALQPSMNHTNVERNDSIHEALRLFHSLRVGCHWGGIASMAVELLTYMKCEAQRLDTFLSSDSEEDTLKLLSRIQHEVQRVVAVVREALPCNPSPYQKSTYSSCVALAVECYLAYVSIHTDPQPVAVPIIGIPLRMSSMEKREHIASAAGSVLFLYDTMDSEHKLQYLHILLTASVAALASNKMLHNDLDCVLGRLGELFLRGGSSESSPKAWMVYYSSNDDGNTSAALWLWFVVAFFDKYSGSLCTRALLPAMMREANVTEWVLAALPKQREILWNMLSRRECHQVVSLHANSVVHVVEQVLETSVSRQEAICMIRLIYSQFKYNCENHFKGRILVNRLLRSLPHIHVLATESEDIVMTCASELIAHHGNDKAIIIVGAQDMRLAYEKNVNLLDWLSSITKNSPSTANFLDRGLSPVAPSVVLTIDAFLFMLDRREEEEEEEEKKNIYNDDDSDDGALVRPIDDVLRWLRPSPRDAAATIPTHKLPQLFLLAPFTHTRERVSLAGAGAEEEIPKNVKFKDGVEESCAIARSVADTPLRSLQASRLGVYLWEEDSESTSATERLALIRNGVNLLSSRRVRTRRASADVTQILRASSSEALDAQKRCGRQFLFGSSSRAGKAAVVMPTRY